MTPLQTQSPYTINTLYIYVFINTRSGGNLGKEYLDALSPGKSCVELEIRSFRCRIYLFDIAAGESGNKPSFQKVSRNLRENPVASASLTSIPSETTICIVAGGDGTVTWFLSELQLHGIEVAELAIGIVPFGTGNDFSRALGWGGSPPRNLVGPQMQGLKEQVQFWLDSKIINYDLWNVNIGTQGKGNFEFVENKKKGLSESKIVTNNICYDETSKEMKLSKIMCNYFSLGFAERAGLGMEKNRTTSTTGNLMAYATEAVKKTLFRRPPIIPDVVESIAIEFEENPQADDRVWSRIRDRNVCLKGEPVELIFLNIPSYGRGADLWKNAKEGGLSENVEELKKFDQLIGDRQISVVSYTSTLSFQKDMVTASLGLLPTLKDSAKRVYQGSGPVQLNFKDRKKAKYKTEGRVYMQIDGEFFICNYPRYVNISYLKNIRVLFSTTPYTTGVFTSGVFC